MKFDLWRGILLLLWLVTNHALAQETGLQTLKQFLATTQGFSADFTQTYAQTQERKTASGEVYLQRPGKFRWEYRQPHIQLIVGDGQKIYVHDPDLNQVTVKRQDDVLGKTPALLLSGGTDLERDFTVQKTQAIDRVSLAITLEPKDKENSFKAVTLTLTQGVLTAMVLLDQFDQETVFTFTKVKQNPNLATTLFQFQPTADMDVIGE